MLWSTGNLLLTCERGRGGRRVESSSQKSLKHEIGMRCLREEDGTAIFFFSLFFSVEPLGDRFWERNMTEKYKFTFSFLRKEKRKRRGAMWTGNSWRKRRRDAIKDLRQLFGLTHAHTYVRDQYLKEKKSYNENVIPSAASIYPSPSWISRKNTTKFKCLCVFWGERRLREISLFISLIIHATLYDQFKYSISKSNIYKKKFVFISFSRGVHEARKWSG